MICLEPLLHRWWGRAYFGLEPIERLPNGTRVCLRWLRKAKFSVRDRVRLDTDPRDHASYMYPEERGVIGMRDFHSGHPLVDGSTFDLTSTDKSTEVSFDLLELQWYLLQMAALCGAAEAADDPTWNPEDDPTIDPTLDPSLEDSDDDKGW
jgi:hypothetical protein